MSKSFVLLSLLGASNAIAGTSQLSTHDRAADGAWQAPAGVSQLPIWPGKAPDAPTSNGVPESVFEVKKVPGRHYVGVANVSTPTMSIFQPTSRSSDAAVVVFPGGGFRILAIDIEGTEICRWVTAELGATCVLLKYRVPGGNHYWDSAAGKHITPPVPFALQDAQRVIRLVRSRAQELGVNPHKVGVIGFSAGGYLVAQTSNTVESSYNPADAADTLSSRPDFAIALYPGHLCRAGNAFDPSIHVSPQTPPTFLLQAWDDPVDNICNSMLYASALGRAGVSAEVHLFSGGGHAFGLRQQHGGITSWPSLVQMWLRSIGVLESTTGTPRGDG